MSRDLQNNILFTNEKILSICYDSKHQSKFESPKNYKARYVRKQNVSRVRETADYLNSWIWDEVIVPKSVT